MGTKGWVVGTSPLLFGFDKDIMLGQNNLDLLNKVRSLGLEGERRSNMFKV